MTVSFSVQKLLSFIRLNLLIADFSTQATIALLQAFFYAKELKTIPYYFFPVQLSISGFILRSLIHLELSFVQIDKYECIWILLYATTQFDQHNLLKIVVFFSPMCISGFFIKNQVLYVNLLLGL